MVPDGANAHRVIHDLMDRSDLRRALFATAGALLFYVMLACLSVLVRLPHALGL